MDHASSHFFGLQYFACIFARAALGAEGGLSDGKIEEMKNARGEHTRVPVPMASGVPA